MTFFETFFGLLWDPGAGRPRETFSGLFGDFLALGPETPSPRSTEPQALGIRLPKMFCVFDVSCLVGTRARERNPTK